MPKITLLFVFAAIWINVSCKNMKTPAKAINQTKNLDIFLLIGQSNMAGRGEIGEADKVPLEKAFLFDGTKWETAAVPLNKYSTVRKEIGYQKMNPGYTFARKLTEYTGRNVGLVVNARGGTSIEQWQKGYSGKDDFDLYEQAIERASKVKNDGVLKGIIWHQGESNQSSSSTYMPKLKQLVQDLRTDLGENAFFGAGEINKWRPESEPMNKVIASIAKEISQSSYIKSDSLRPINNDENDPHFDGFSQRILGGLYADEILKNVYKMSPGVASFYSECDFKGYKATLKEGIYPLEELEKRGMHDNAIQSLQLDKGYETLLFTEQKKGESLLVSTSKNCLRETAVNKDVSYVIVGKKGKTSAMLDKMNVSGNSIKNKKK